MVSPSVFMISPGVLNIPRCTAHHPVYCTDIMQGGNMCQHCINSDTNTILKESASLQMLKNKVVFKAEHILFK